MDKKTSSFIMDMLKDVQAGGSPDFSNFRLHKLSDNKVWELLIANAKINPKNKNARYELDCIIRKASTPKAQDIIPSEVKKKLRDQAKAASKLVVGVERLRRGSNEAWSALHSAGGKKGQAILGYNMDAELDALLLGVLDLKQWLEKAEKKVRDGTRGQKDVIRKLVRQIDKWHITHGGGGLVRSSGGNRDSKAEKHKQFAKKIIELAGISAAETAIDDAMKASISCRRRRVGSLL